MNGSKRSILFFEDSIDLGHLKQLLESFEIESKFCRDVETFFEQVNTMEYDILVVSGVGNNNFPVIDTLYASANTDTPIIYIADNNYFPPLDELLRQKLNIITFPFSAEELLYRSVNILRSAETDLNLHNSLSSYRNILDNLPIGIIQTDAYGKFLKINTRFLSIVNMSEIDLFKENFFQLCHPDDYFLERKQLDRLLKKELSCVDYEIRLINNEGMTSVCAVEASILWTGKDIFDSFLFLIRKIS